MRDEHLDTIPTTESDEVIKSSVEILVPIPSEFEGISDDSCDMPICDNNCVNVESDFVESLINPDFDPKDDTSSDDDNFEDIKYVSLEEVNEVDQEKDFDLEDILQIQDVILREKLLNSLMKTKGEVRMFYFRMLKMTIPSHLSFGFFSHSSPTPRPLLYLAPPRVKIRSLTPASPLRAGGISSGWNFHDYPDFEDSFAHGFVHVFELHILSFI
ncbi:hypothetical protein Tco_0456598 [Tanacetum coccineum]